MTKQTQNTIEEKKLVKGCEVYMKTSKGINLMKGTIKCLNQKK